MEKIIEIGTFTGGTALMWAQLIESNGVVFCLDQKFDWGGPQAYKNTPYEKYIIEMQGDTHSPEYIKIVKEKTGLVDFLFIDGDHSYQGVKQDFFNYLPLVKKGGYVAFHDIIDSEYHRSKGCFVSPFWQEIKHRYKFWEFIDNNEYGTEQSHSMGIGVLKID